MTLLDKEPVKRVEKKLKEFDPNSEVIVLSTSARTALEAASSLGCEVGAIVKSLLFKTENSFTLCLVAGDKRASLNSIKKLLKIINHDAERIERLITDYTQMLKDEASLSREKMGKINLAEIINDVVEDFNQDLVNQNKKLK